MTALLTVFKRTFMKNNCFYCYSDKLNYFLLALKFRWLSTGVNKNTNKKYWVYKKSKELDSAIMNYNNLKHKYN